MSVSTNRLYIVSLTLFALGMLCKHITLNCAAGCLTCKSSTFCESCIDGYYLLYQSCYQCMENCGSCTSLKTCNQCKIGYRIEGSGCVFDTDKMVILMFALVAMISLFLCAGLKFWFIWKRKRERKQLALKLQQVHDQYQVAPENEYHPPEYGFDKLVAHSPLKEPETAKIVVQYSHLKKKVSSNEQL